MRKTSATCRSLMTSEIKPRIGRRARADYRIVLRYSKQRWGVDQQRAYAMRLTEGMESVRSNRCIGRRRSDIEEGLRSHPVEEQVMFYLITERSVTIVRILHHRMDAVTPFRTDE